MPLSDLAIKNAKPKDRKYKLSDAHGLYLTVLPSGCKAFKMAYRFAGKQRELTIGEYPLVGLGEARTAREDARRLLAAGEDPSLRKKLDKIARAEDAAQTFKAVGEEWLARIAAEGAADATVSKQAWLLGLACGAIGARPVSQVTPPEILTVLRRVEKSGRLETARRLRSTISQVFRFAIRTARAIDDPTIALVGATQAPKVSHRAAILDEAEIGPLMRAIAGYQGKGSVTRAALEIVARTFVRSKELRYAVKAEFDLKAALWTIPEERMKMRRPHLVPLSIQAVALFEEWLDATPGDLVFPSVRSCARPISENTVNAALRRMGYEKADMTGHGFRRMASTILNEQGWNPDWIERQLAHAEEDKVRRAYNAAEWLADRRRMMQHWSDYLDRLRDDDADLIG